MKIFETNAHKICFVSVPADSSNFFINNVGCIRYSQNEGKESTAITPAQLGEYLEKDDYEILGEVSEERISFDFTPYFPNEIAVLCATFSQLFCLRRYMNMLGIHFDNNSKFIVLEKFAK